MAYQGYRSTNPPDYGIIGAGQTRVYVPDPMPEDGWVTAVGARVGRNTANTPPTIFSMWHTDGGANPAGRYGYTNSVNPSTLMTAGSNGAMIESGFASVDADWAWTTTAVRAFQGSYYGIGITPSTYTLGHGMVQQALEPALSGDNTEFYYRNGFTVPPSPLGGTHDTQGWMDAWLVYTPNTAPAAPNFRVPSGSVTTTTPTFQANFNDSESGIGDKLNQYEVELRRVGFSTLLWDQVYTASSGEKAAAQMDRAYGGSALTLGWNVEWRTRHSDMFGTWGPWSSWLTVNIASAGTVTLDGAPTGKISATSTTFQWRWFHQSGLAANAVAIRILQGSTVVKTSPTITRSPTVASSALPGTLDTITWAETTFGTLTPGILYSYQVQARDTGSVWSAWSAARTFRVNAAPNTPTMTSPAAGATVTTPPLVRIKLTDIDSTAAQVGGKLRVYNSGGTQIGSDLSMSLVAGTSDTYQFQLTSTQLATFGTYKLAAFGTDELGASGNLSPQLTIIYASGPVITMTDPTYGATVTTATPRLSYTVSTDQAKQRVRLIRVSTGKVLYDTTLLTTSNQFFDVPTGYLHHGESYDAEITVQNAALLSGTYTVRFTLSFTLPAPIGNLQGVVHSAKYDNGKGSMVLLTFDPPPVPPEQVQAVVITRWVSASLLEPEGIDEDIDADFRVLYRGQEPYLNRFYDGHPAPGLEYTYGISYSIKVGNSDILQSADSTVTVSLDLHTIVINDANNPLGMRIVAHAWKPEVTEDWDQDDFLVQTWGEVYPNIVVGPSNYKTVQGTLIFFDEPGFPARRDLEAEAERIKTGARTVCYRDPFIKQFGMIRAWKLTRKPGRITELQFILTTTNYPEGTY